MYSGLCVYLVGRVAAKQHPEQRLIKRGANEKTKLGFQITMLVFIRTALEGSEEEWESG